MVRVPPVLMPGNAACCAYGFVKSAVGYLGGVAGCGATILLEDWFQLGESSDADVRTDAIIMLNQDLLLLT